MILTETSVITEVTLLPQDGSIQVKWRNSVLKDGEVIAATDHYEQFSADKQANFTAKVENADKYIAAMGW